MNNNIKGISKNQHLSKTKRNKKEKKCDKYKFQASLKKKRCINQTIYHYKLSSINLKKKIIELLGINHK